MRPTYLNRAERDAARRGFEDATARWTGFSEATRIVLARKAYPAPMVTRTRTRMVDGLTYFVKGGTLSFMSDGSEETSSMNGDAFVATVRAYDADDLATLIDLIKHPTETVEVDA